ncbi:hypothetical protein [Halovivax cerinus]|uniref:UDP-N-acetyl-D-mannosamine dehydrogenase n=1 Tax=Halovivax cerinus TaxID=1487865 RepID=A0ABD5NK04_9EURY|nr:hypothetical protein [Halovivax cerinus]
MRHTDTLTIEVIGAGTVGEATGLALDDWGHEVVFKDLDHDVLDSLDADGHRTATPDEAIDADLSLIAVPTPYDETTNELRTTYVESAVETLADQDPSVVAVRSTVPPGTTDALATTYDIDDYAMVPEFLFAETAREDIAKMESLVIGTQSRLALETIKCAFGPQVATFVELTPTEAEFLKFGSNLFAATKISFSNQLWRLMEECRSASVVDEAVDPDRVLSGVSQITPWTGPEMGWEGGWPYGGHCLPKDTRGLRGWAEDRHDIPVPQLSGTIEENELVDAFEEHEEDRRTTVAAE